MKNTHTVVLGLLLVPAIAIAQSVPVTPPNTAPPTKSEQKALKDAKRQSDKEAAANRQTMAKEYENKLLDDGSLGDVTVRAVGPNSTQLVIYTSVVSKVLFHQLDPNIRSTFARAIQAGFTQLTIRYPDNTCDIQDSCTHTWYF